MGYFAVIDTETNWNDQVMSIGTIIADSDTFTMVSARYHILTPEYRVGGMFSSTLFDESRLRPIVCSRKKAIGDLLALFEKYDVDAIFSYNAKFDRTHLPELRAMDWYDIMRLAAYRQYNSALPPYAEYCSTGRLKRGFGVEPMLRLLSGDTYYHETHNAIYDAIDELQIMRLLGHPLTAYIPL